MRVIRRTSKTLKLSQFEKSSLDYHENMVDLAFLILTRDL